MSTPSTPGQGNNPHLFKVASTSNPASVAGAIAGTIRERGRCEMQAIGAGAINQAVKAIAIARGYVAPAGIDLVFIPAFLDITVAGEERTAIKFVAPGLMALVTSNTNGVSPPSCPPTGVPFNQTSAL